MQLFIYSNFLFLFGYIIIFKDSKVKTIVIEYCSYCEYEDDIESYIYKHTLKVFDYLKYIFDCYEKDPSKVQFALGY